MKHTIKLLTLAFTLATIFMFTGCPGPVNTIEPPVWDDGVVTKEPTCTEDGEKTYTNTNGETKTETIPALGHDYGDWVVTKVATCTEDGDKKHTCKREGCGYFETEVIPAAHDYQGGYCERCGAFEFKDGLKVLVGVYTLENNELVKKEDIWFSFEDKDVEMELNDLIHLKTAYKNYIITYCSYYSYSDLLSRIKDDWKYIPWVDRLNQGIDVVVEPITE